MQIAFFSGLKKWLTFIPQNRSFTLPLFTLQKKYPEQETQVESGNAAYSPGLDRKNIQVIRNINYYQKRIFFNSLSTIQGNSVQLCTSYHKNSNLLKGLTLALEEVTPAVSYLLLIFILIFRNPIRLAQLVAASKRSSEAISSLKGSTGSIVI